MDDSPVVLTAIRRLDLNVGNQVDQELDCRGLVQVIIVRLRQDVRRLMDYERLQVLLNRVILDSVTFSMWHLYYFRPDPVLVRQDGYHLWQRVVVVVIEIYSNTVGLHWDFSLGDPLMVEEGEDPSEEILSWQPHLCDTERLETKGS